MQRLMLLTQKFGRRIVRTRHSNLIDCELGTLALHNGNQCIDAQPILVGQHIIA